MTTRAVSVSASRFYLAALLASLATALFACSGEVAPPPGPGTTGGPSAGLPGSGLTPPPPPGAGCPVGQTIINGACAPTPGVPGPGGPPVAPVVPPVAPACLFDTHTVFMFGNRVVESLTNRGRLFNFEADGSGWTTNGMDLTQVPYFASGPCAGQAPGHCKLDTRTFALFPGNHLIEFVTAYGRSWAFENGTPTEPGTDIATMPRYAEICALRGGGPCTFDTRTFVNVDGQLMEAITAFGRYFAYDRAGARSKDNGADLALVPRYAAGPCKGRPPGQCRLDTRTYGLVDGKTVEVVTANGFVWRYLAGEQSGFAEVQPSGVPLLNVPAWTAPCQ